jgi:hypothetical protein
VAGAPGNHRQVDGTVRWLKSLLGPTEAAPEVVQPRAPMLRNALLIATIVVAVFALYVTYELGRYDAGYDRQAAAQQRNELEVKIDKLEQSDREMRTQIAESDTIRVGRSHEQAEVARSIEELQAQVARQSQELAFYRGLVAQKTVTLGVKVDQLHIIPGTRPGSYLVKLALVRAGRADADVAGTLHLILEGASTDGPKSLELPYLTGGHVRDIKFSFRYLQSLQQDIAFPQPFKPEQLTVELESSRKDVPPLSQSFRWNVETSP